MSSHTVPASRVIHTGQRQQAGIQTQRVSSCHTFRAALRMPCSRSITASSKGRQSTLICRAEQSATEESRPLVKTQPPSDDASGSWVPVITPEDLPKGQRKEVTVSGVSILLFWYRNDIFAIESRSPAEGAYSEGFITSKFTQDFCIECPATSSLFSLKTGEIVSWYPNNPVLRMLTPQDTCRKLQIYPVKLTQDYIMVDVAGSGIDNQSQGTRGGSDSSLEKNNVYGIEPKVYTEAPPAAASVDVGTVATSTISIVGCLAVAAAGTAVCNYLETTIGLYIFGAAYVAIVGAYISGKAVKM